MCAYVACKQLYFNFPEQNVDKFTVNMITRVKNKDEIWPNIEVHRLL